MKQTKLSNINIIDIKPFFGGSGIFFKGLLPGDKRVNIYYIYIGFKLSKLILYKYTLLDYKL